MDQTQKPVWLYTQHLRKCRTYTHSASMTNTNILGSAIATIIVIVIIGAVLMLMVRRRHP